MISPSNNILFIENKVFHTSLPEFHSTFAMTYVKQSHTTKWIDHLLLILQECSFRKKNISFQYTFGEISAQHSLKIQFLFPWYKILFFSWTNIISLLRDKKWFHAHSISSSETWNIERNEYENNFMKTNEAWSS